MKTTLNVSIDADLKKEFSNFAKSMGANPSVLINMFIASSVRTRSIEFRQSPTQYIEEFEPTQRDILEFEDFKLREKKGELETVELTDEVLLKLI